MKSVRRMSLLLVLLALLIGVAGTGAQDDEPAPTVLLGGTEELGDFLVGPDGFTLYLFTNDEPGVSNCTGGCLENWPPLLVEDGVVPFAEEGIPGRLSFIPLEDGTRHVTYNGWPLYYWVNDEAPGDTTGQDVGGVWFVVNTPDVSAGGNTDLGSFLVGPDGYTLYIFTNDEPGVSNCTGGCLEAWPALTVESEDLYIEMGLNGDFGTITREDDGTLQVTLEGMPLYYWVEDEAPGDATGHEVGDVWFVATVPDIAVVEDEDFGEILVGNTGLTLYTFSNDEEGVSNCNGGCALNWPPLLTGDGVELFIDGDLPGELGTIEREDGSTQITYNGEPLYYWIFDIVPGDTTGHEVGDVWFVATP